MTKDDKIKVYNLLKTASDNLCGYASPDFAGEMPEFADDIEVRSVGGESDVLTPEFLRRVVYSSHQFSIVYKDGPLKDIRDAIEAASHCGRYISQRAMEIVISRQQEEEAHPSILTDTETEIVKAIAQGKTTKEIAEERFSSVHTITTHRKNIFRKLKVNTAHEVIKYALRAGLVDSSEFYI